MKSKKTENATTKNKQYIQKNQSGKPQNNKKKNHKKPVGLIVATSILAVSTLAVGGWAVGMSIESANLKTNLNTIYQKGYYDFYDAINNTEIKMNKVISTSDNALTKKYLNEISKNANEAQSALNNLPISTNGIEKSLTFINQVAGFTNTLANKLDKGGSLSQDDKATLLKLNSSIADMKRNLNKMTSSMNGGYDILSNSMNLDGDYNTFTISMQNMNASDIEYPSMIYDGPFADSQIKKEIKGLPFENVEESTARQNLSNIIKVGVEKIELKSENRGRFEAYNYQWQDDNQNYYFAQVTKKGGRLINMTSQKDVQDVNLNIEQAITIATLFLEENKINDVECVWNDTIGGNAYLNFAPIEDGIILYPDLIKLKIDLADGVVLGFEATSYFTNHTSRNFKEFEISKQYAKDKIDSQYEIETVKKVLAPIDYAEILCWEIKSTYADSTYYFYIDSQSGQTVNILKVVQTNDGSKLM